MKSINCSSKFNNPLQKNKNFINEINKYEKIIKSIIYEKQNTNLDFDLSQNENNNSGDARRNFDKSLQN